jgi:glycosyltransferase involved in cell wall biosynthesis
MLAEPMQQDTMLNHTHENHANQANQTRQQAPNSTAPACCVSIIIKTLNEEKGIAATLESALRAIESVGGEVILADSLSTDRTVEIARRYPVRIVQLMHPEERCCGVGPQLGYQYAQGEFIYLMDGDMELLDGFLEQALSFMAQHPDIAGVGGRVREMNLSSPEYRARHAQWAELNSGPSSRLDGGGLYRRSAIEAAGYFSDRNLHSYEEFDLAARLRALGWGFWRLPVNATSHYGHETPPYQLLWRRWRNGYLWGIGELLRASAHEPRQRLLLALKEVREIRIYAAVLVWWAVLLALMFLPTALGYRVSAVLLLFLAPLALMSWRKRSVTRGLYAVAAWSFNAAGMARGLFRKPRFSQPIVEGRLLQETRPVQPRHATNSTALATNPRPESIYAP